MGVIAEADFTLQDLPPAPAVIVMASDGLWDFVSSDEAISVASKYPKAK